MVKKKTCKVSGNNFSGNSRIVEVAEHLKDAMLDEQARIIRNLKKENEALRRDNVRWQELYYATEDRLKGEKLQRNFFEQSFKSAKKRLSEKREVVDTLNEEVAYQYNRREKAEKILALVAESLRDFSEKVKAYE